MPVTPINPHVGLDLVAVYDAYFSTHAYERRYPRPNAATLAFLLTHGAGEARSVLDVGCGSGRYAIPILDCGKAHMVGCDVSSMAIDNFAQRLAVHPFRERARLVVGGPQVLRRGELFDCILMLFGVLSHVSPREGRLQMLRELRERVAPQGRLLMSVPSIWRRRPFEVMASFLKGRGTPPGDILFTRDISGKPRTFFYHLYTVRRLREELSEAGWHVEAVDAESLLPEWLITQSPRWARLDAWVQPWVPGALGYGIRVVARPSASPPLSQD